MSTNDVAVATTETDEEIEITPEMIEAGIDAYLACEWHSGVEEWVVSEIFKSMWRAQKGGGGSIGIASS
jgi:hypothetical protein